jgi:hypothetical protein
MTIDDGKRAMIGVGMSPGKKAASEGTIVGILRIAITTGMTGAEGMTDRETIGRGYRGPDQGRRSGRGHTALAAAEQRPCIVLS